MSLLKRKPGRCCLTVSACGTKMVENMPDAGAGTGFIHPAGCRTGLQRPAGLMKPVLKGTEHTNNEPIK